MISGVNFARVGIAVGHASDVVGGTGVTVIREMDRGLRAGVAVFGRATGSRELHVLSPHHLLAGRIDALMLAGGSAYGLDAAAGVMRWMEENRHGFPVGLGVVPIVPAAVIFDLSFGWFDARPTPQMGYEATAQAAPTGVAEGSVGAGTGATVGKIFGPDRVTKGGFGCAIESTRTGALAVAAMAVVNAFGDVRDADGVIIAGARSGDGMFADIANLLRKGGIAPANFGNANPQNTTLAVVAASHPLSVTQLTDLAHSAGAALFRRITPCGTSFDGDIVFALSPATGDRTGADMMVFEALAVTALERAIERAVRFAHGREGIPGMGDEP